MLECDGVADPFGLRQRPGFLKEKRIQVDRAQGRRAETLAGEPAGDDAASASHLEQPIGRAYVCIVQHSAQRPDAGAVAAAILEDGHHAEMWSAETDDRVALCESRDQRIPLGRGQQGRKQKQSGSLSGHVVSDSGHAALAIVTGPSRCRSCRVLAVEEPAQHIRNPLRVVRGHIGPDPRGIVRELDDLRFGEHSARALQSLPADAGIAGEYQQPIRHVGKRIQRQARGIQQRQRRDTLRVAGDELAKIHRRGYPYVGTLQPEVPHQLTDALRDARILPGAALGIVHAHSSSLSHDMRPDSPAFMRKLSPTAGLDPSSSNARNPVERRTPPS